MSRFVLDCAVSRPVDPEAAQWLGMAAVRSWASPTGGYHEAKISHALLMEAARTLATLAGGTSAAFAADLSGACLHALLDTAVHGRYERVAVGAADPLVLQDSALAAANQLGLPYLVLEVDSHARIVQIPPRTLLITSAVNQEIGTIQTDLGPASADGAVVLDASCAFGWTQVPQSWDALILDPRAWGSAPGAVATISHRSRVTPPFDNVAAAVAAGLTAQRWSDAAAGARDRVREQMRWLTQQIAARVPDVQIHGGADSDVPHILSVSVLYVDAQALQTRLDAKGYAVGSGSACASRTGQPSHVLQAIGGLTSGNVRLGLPPGLPDEAVTGFVDAFAEVVEQVRAQMGTAGL